jgi:hypothetical protein
LRRRSEEPRPPCTETILRRSCQGSVVSCQKQPRRKQSTVEDSPGNIYSAHNRIFSNRPSLTACAITARKIRQNRSQRL